MNRLLAALQRVPAWAWSLLAGAAAALAHPPFGLLPGVFALGGMMVLADDAANGRSAFWRGWLAGLSYFTIGCYWVAEAFLVDAKTFGWMAPIAVAGLAAGLALFWGAGLLLYRFAIRICRVEGAWRILVFAGAFAALEWLRGHLLTGFPWNMPATSFAAGSPPSQMVAVVGSYGFNWIILAIAGAAAFAMRERDGKVVHWVAASGASAIGLIYLYGVWVLIQPLPATGVALRIVQPNQPQLAAYDDAASRAIAADYLRWTVRAPRPAGPMVVVWPEGALPDAALIEPGDDLAPARQGFLATGHPVRAGIEQALRPGDVLLMGGVRVDRNPPDVRYFNSLIALERTAGGLKQTGVYDKHRLVPFGEYLPLPGLLHAVGFQQLVPISDGFSGGGAPRPLSVGKLILQPLICYEALFPGFTGSGFRASRQRASLIVNVSTDAWFGQTSGPLQHLNQAAYRAIEEGVPEVRATPTGVSAIIDARGRVLSRKQLGVAGLVEGDLPAVINPTIYSLTGDLLFVVMLAVSCLICLYCKVFTTKKA